MYHIPGRSPTGSPQQSVVPACVTSITVTDYGAEGGISNGVSGSGGGQATAGGGGSSYISAPGNSATSTTPGVRTGNGEVLSSY